MVEMETKICAYRLSTRINYDDGCRKQPKYLTLQLWVRSINDGTPQTECYAAIKTMTLGAILNQAQMCSVEMPVDTM